MTIVVFVWQDTFYTLLVKFREACVRWALDIKLQFARRLHSNLTEGVSKETREEFIELVKFNDGGFDFSVTAAFSREVQAAEDAKKAQAVRT